LYDAVVAGGGSCGSRVAQHITAEGFKVLLVEEHEQVGHPNHCAGLVTRRTSTISELPSHGLIHGASSHWNASRRGMGHRPSVSTRHTPGRLLPVLRGLPAVAASVAHREELTEDVFAIISASR